MKKLYTLIPLLVAACASDSDHNSGSKQDARRALISTTHALGSIEGRAAALAPGLTTTINFTAPCSSAGSLGIDGTHNLSDDGLKEDFDISAKFIGCSEGDGALDGEVNWTAAIDNGNFESSLTGTLDWADATTSASCTFDLHVKASATSVSFSGTACGYDVSELDLDADDLGIDTDL